MDRVAPPPKKNCKMLNNKSELTNWAQKTKHKNTNWHQNLSQQSSTNPIFVVRKWAPQEVVLFLTLEVVPKLTLERPKSGTKTNSPAYIYIYIHPFICYYSGSLSSAFLLWDIHLRSPCGQAYLLIHDSPCAHKLHNKRGRTPTSRLLHAASRRSWGPTRLPRQVNHIMGTSASMCTCRLEHARWKPWRKMPVRKF